MGGTAIRFVVRQDGVTLDSALLPTAGFDDCAPEAVVARLAEQVRRLLPPDAALAAIGIGASGPIDLARGVICNEYTLPRFSGFPIVDGLATALGCPVAIDNDAMVAALAEHRLGAGQRARRMLMVTLGTGIGVALLVDGEPFRGLAGAHPEGGHIPILGDGVRCYCGAEGCWEPAASRAALQERLRPLLRPNTATTALVETAAAMAAHDPGVAAAFTAYGRLVGRGLSVLHTLYMPEVTVIGGSAAAQLHLFRAGMDTALLRTPGFAVLSKIRPAVLGEAGAVGAALLVEPNWPATPGSFQS